MSEDDEIVQHSDIMRPQDQPYMIADVFESMSAELAISRLDVAQHKARATQAHRMLAEEQSKVRALAMENADLMDQLRVLTDQAPNASA